VLDPHLLIPFKFLFFLDCQIRIGIFPFCVKKCEFELLKFEGWSFKVVIEVIAELPDVDQLFEFVGRN